MSLEPKDPQERAPRSGKLLFWLLLFSVLTPLALFFFALHIIAHDSKLVASIVCVVALLILFFAPTRVIVLWLYLERARDAWRERSKGA